jgi:hypothetical protein
MLDVFERLRAFIFCFAKFYMNTIKRLERIMEERLGNEPVESDVESELEEDSEVDELVSEGEDSGKSDDSEEELEEIIPEPKKSKAAPKKESRKVVVVVHQESTRRTTQQNAGIHSFMSSKVKLTNGENELVKKHRTPKEIERDKQNKNDDTELESLIKTSRLVEQFNAEQLTGKERQKYLKAQLVKLGGKVFSLID